MSTENIVAEAEGNAESPQHTTTPKRFKRKRTQVGRLLDVEKGGSTGMGASDTNVDGVGSHADVMLRRNSSLGETAWNDVGCAQGLQAWRLDDWKPVADRTAAAGTLRASFCYLFLQTQLLSGSKEFSYHVFYWVGPKSPLESQAGAAYKSVELQSYLWGHPTVSRIEDPSEGVFRDLWPAGGPNIVEDDGPEAEGWLRPPPDDAHVVQLLLVNDLSSGFQCHPVKMSPMSLFDDSCYILDTGEVLVIWEGENCSVFERAKAGMAARRLLEERNGRGRIIYAHEEPSFFDCLTEQEEEHQHAEIPVYSITMPHPPKPPEPPPRPQIDFTPSACLPIGAGVVSPSPPPPSRSRPLSEPPWAPFVRLLECMSSSEQMKHT